VPPPAEFGARLQEPVRLCAWRAGELIGYLDGAYGATADTLDLPEHRPEGLIRFLACPLRSEAGGEQAAEVLRVLLERVEAHWRDHKVERMVAFHPSSGFRAFQAGAGILPGEWAEHVRELTAAGWVFRQRYYALTRATGAPLEEECPLADLSLVQQRTQRGRSYLVYHRRVELVAQARVLGMRLDRTGTAEQLLHLLHIEVSEIWRNRNLGKWLLRRILNDAGHGGYQEVLAFVPMNLPIALNLLVQTGFAESNYRGYTLDKTIAPQATDARPLRYS
jgi:ribosomal protein S18 acetylase RimI-like enzyme